jgi:peptidoglycan/LPS O-acetylase OafA/YrhL
MNLKNLKFLHIIRGFAAFFVMLAHAKWPFWVGGNAFIEGRSFSSLGLLDKLGFAAALCSSNGTAMVIVFFVLSGFMITYSYNKNKWSYGQFLVNRSLRIYIPYIASMILAGVLFYFSFRMAGPLFRSGLKDYHQGVTNLQDHGLTVLNYLQTLFFYRNDANYVGFNYVYWSLLFECLFYLIFPLINRYYKQFLLFSAILYPIHFFVHLPEMPWFLLYFFVKFLVFFCVGVWLFHYIKSPSFQPDKWWLQKTPLRIAVLGSFVGIVVTGFLFPFGVSFIFATIMSMAWILFILRFGVWNNLPVKAMQWVGVISYSLYLVHVPILLFFYSLVYKLFGKTTYSSPWAYLPFVFAVLPLAWLFYQLFEKSSFAIIEKHKKRLREKHKIPNTTSVTSL